MEGVLEKCFKDEYEIEKVTREDEPVNYSIQAAVEPNLYRGLHDVFSHLKLAEDGQIDFSALKQANKDEEAKQPEASTKKAAGARSGKKAKARVPSPAVPNPCALRF